ncbi:MAG: DUF885 domain-containing protein [Candidatus Hadarchaeota archaeon]
MGENEKFGKINDEMFKRLLGLNPDFATYIGLHDPYDSLLPDGSTANVKANLALMEEWVGRLEKEVDREGLSVENRIDWEVLEMSLEMGRFYFHEYRVHERDPDALEGLGGLLFVMFVRDYAPLEKRIGAIAARMEKAPQYLKEFRTKFERSTPVKLWTEIALETCRSVPAFFKSIPEYSKGKVSDKAQKRIEESVRELEKSLPEHERWLESLLRKAKDDWPLGKEKFEKLLQLRGLGMSADEIRGLGWKFLIELKERRASLSERIAPRKPVEEVIRMIERDCPKTFDEALDFVRSEVIRARQFIREKNLATVSDDDLLKVERTPDFMATLTPFAALYMPAKFDRPQVGVYVVAEPKNQADLGRHLNYPSIRNTAVHEAFPGHFLQGAASNRASVVRLLVGATETVEGWAHYCEHMMMEHGFSSDPKTEFVQVNDQIWRAVRIIVDVGLSRGEMGFGEAVEMLVKETGMPVEAAVAEVRRYTKSPGYPLSYLLGKHLILQLRADVERKMGGKFSERKFNDKILLNGYLPFHLLKKLFLL